MAKLGEIPLEEQKFPKISLSFWQEGKKKKKNSSQGLLCPRKQAEFG
jgi:hypothetical protein